LPTPSDRDERFGQSGRHGRSPGSRRGPRNAVR
jgi:hypothetical protein